MEKFREPLPAYRWLPTAFFSLHRRRQFREEGRYQPISYQEMAAYATHVLRLDPSVMPLFYLTMEETDNAVMYDQTQKVNAFYEKAKAEREKPKARGQRQRSQG